MGMAIYHVCQIFVGTFMFYNEVYMSIFDILLLNFLSLGQS